MLRLKKALNNNVVLVIDENKEETIVLGKGIGYHKKIGEIIDQKLITKIFKQEINNRLLKSLKDISPLVIETTECIIEYGSSKLNSSIDDSIFLNLADHINFALERKEKGFQVEHLLQWEIPHLYPQEMEIGNKALDIIEKNHDVRFQQVEASMVALHFVNAQTDGLHMEETILITEVIKTIMNLVHSHFHMDISKNMEYYSRFVTHLRFFVSRLNNSKTITNDTSLNNHLFKLMKEKYIKSYDCGLKIKKMLKEKYQWDVSDDELVYLVIHIERIVMP